MVDVFFAAMAVLSVGGAVLALEAREIVYAAVSLAGSLFGVAALFFILNAPYVGVFQITIYVGAVAVLILFTVMLVRPQQRPKESISIPGRVAGIITAGALAFALLTAFAASKLSDFTTQSGTATFLQIGQLISTNFSPALEVLALVLAASVFGALTLARIDREDDS
jgi:NADH:ubiquinone oxidoreductase subunit 6 (subunit J)